MTTSPPAQTRRKSRSQPIESASRWFVGSSSSRVCAPENRIRASSTRRRWPPDRVPSSCAEHPVGQPEARADRRRLALGGVPAAGGELGLEPAVPGHRGVAALVVRAGHRALGLPHLPDDLVQPAGREHPVAGELLEVAGARVLREVADVPGAGDRAGRGLPLTGQDLGQGGLAGAVAADQADPVPGRDPEGRVLHEDPGTGAQLDVVGDDHDGRGSRQRGSRDPAMVGGPALQFAAWVSSSTTSGSTCPASTTAVAGGVGGGVAIGGGAGIVGLIIYVLVALLGGDPGQLQLPAAQGDQAPGQVQGETRRRAQDPLQHRRRARQVHRLPAHQGLQRRRRRLDRRVRPARACRSTPRGSRSSPARRPPAAARPPPRSGRSTARPTRRSTSSWASWSSSSSSSAPRARSRRRTSPPTSTATTCRPCSAPSRKVRAAQQRDPSNANEYSVALELQADCYAGVWANLADKRAENGIKLTRGQHRRGGQRGRRRSATTGSSRRCRAGSTRRRWTHGSAEQRQHVVPHRLPLRRHRLLQHLRVAAARPRVRPVTRTAGWRRMRGR